jgi:hypothetical protein
MGCVFSVAICTPAPPMDMPLVHICTDHAQLGLAISTCTHLCTHVHSCMLWHPCATKRKVASACILRHEGLPRRVALRLLSRPLCAPIKPQCSGGHASISKAIQKSTHACIRGSYGLSSFSKRTYVRALCAVWPACQVPCQRAIAMDDAWAHQICMDGARSELDGRIQLSFPAYCTCCVDVA